MVKLKLKIYTLQCKYKELEYRNNVKYLLNELSISFEADMECLILINEFNFYLSRNKVISGNRVYFYVYLHTRNLEKCTKVLYRTECNLVFFQLDQELLIFI